MSGKLPIPQGPILNWIKSECQGEGHETKQTITQETADLVNKILASHAFDIERPDSPSPEHRARSDRTSRPTGNARSGSGSSRNRAMSPSLRARTSN